MLGSKANVLKRLISSKPRLKPRRKRGQGITEYGAIIAFVAVLVSITFGLSKGSLMPAVSCAFSAVANQINNMCTAANSASS